MEKEMDTYDCRNQIICIFIPFPTKNNMDFIPKDHDRHLGHFWVKINFYYTWRNYQNIFT